jgi:hypothetical protein
VLELRKEDGRIMAVSYGYLERAAYEPSEGITLSIAGRRIQIKGRNLNAESRPTLRLFQGITRHRVACGSVRRGMMRQLWQKKTQQS